ncbi:MAG: pyridoxal phosphate-dependent aminotransferase [Deltaproteobacteria bacterium]|nr:pyridoxal phosphate-dependent aminotransferase [Deltaproteobacteria bacterium]
MLNKLTQAYRNRIREGKPVLSLVSGNPNDNGFIFPSEILQKEYARYFNKQDYHPDPKGLLKARKSVCQYYSGQGAFFQPEEILFTAGTSESFFYLFSYLCEAGDNILAPNPAYPLFDDIARLAKIELRHYPLDEKKGWEIDFDALEQRIDSKTKAIVLISPNNPTGAVASAKAIQNLARIAHRYNLAVISDEVFSEFYFGKEIFPRARTVADFPLLFTLNGLSKMFALPALKLGWIAVSGEKNRVGPAVDALETLADTFLSVHTPIQKALPSILEQGKNFKTHTIQEVTSRRNLCLSLLKDVDSIHFHPPQGGFYLTAKIEKKEDEEDFVIRLLEQTEVLVHPGYFYDYEEGIHIVFSYLAEPALLTKALPRLIQFCGS